MNTTVARLALAAGVLVGTVGSAAHAVPDPQSSGACRLSGLASFTTGLPATDSDRTYSLKGDVTSCAWSPRSSLPTNGTLSVGQITTEAATGFKWQEPLGAVTGNCKTSAGQATAIVTWTDGSVTVASFETRSVVGGFAAVGSIVSEVALTAVNPQTGQAATKTLATTRYEGAAAASTIAIPSLMAVCPIGDTGLSFNGGLGIALPGLL